MLKKMIKDSSDIYQIDKKNLIPLKMYSGQNTKNLRLDTWKSDKGAEILTASHQDSSVITVNLSKGGTIGSHNFIMNKETDAESTDMFVSDDEFYTYDIKDSSTWKKVKANFPIFPVFNTLLERYYTDAAVSKVPNHGYGRISSCQAFVDEQREKIVLLMRDNKETRKAYPYKYTFYQMVSFNKNSLRVEFDISSKGKFAAGYHPYFLVSDDIEIDGVQEGDLYLYLPNSLEQNEKNKIIEGGKFKTYQGFDLKNREINDHFINVKRPITIIDHGLKRKITITSSPNLDCRTVYKTMGLNELCVESISALSGHFTPGLKPDRSGYNMRGFVEYRIEPLD